MAPIRSIILFVLLDLLVLAAACGSGEVNVGPGDTDDVDASMGSNQMTGGDAGTVVDSGPVGATQLVIETTSTRDDWAPREVINGGATLVWSVTGDGLEGAAETTDAPTFDLSSNSGTATIVIESEDRFAQLESLQFDEAGIVSVEGLDALSQTTTFALRTNPIEAIDVSGLTSIDNLTIRTGELGEIDLSNLSTLRLLWVYENNLSELDITQNANLEYVNATDNRLDSAALDAIVVALDEHGKRDGELFLAGNPGQLSESVLDEYQSLIAKGWTIDLPAPVEGVRSLAEWETMLEQAWASDRDDAFELARSGGKEQEHYFLFYDIEGLFHGWMATGDLTYLDAALDLIEETIDDAVPLSGRNDGYMGWPSADRFEPSRVAEGTSLWEIYLYRIVGSILRVMHQSPNLRAMGNYQARYDAILAFTERNIWEKWYQADPDERRDIYRSRTHIASHWARLGMELYLITGEQEYKDVFDAISFGGMPRWDGASLRSRLYDNPADPAAYSLYQEWDNPRVQDTSHGADVISFWVVAIENEMHWGQAPNTDDAARLVRLVDSVVWGSNDPLQHAVNWDGTGGLTDHDSGFHGSLMVGRFDPQFQNRIETHYTLQTSRYSDTQAMGIGAYNRKILNDGRPVYPEHYIPVDGP